MVAAFPPPIAFASAPIDARPVGPDRRGSRELCVARGWAAYATQSIVIACLLGCPAEAPPNVLGTTPRFDGFESRQTQHVTITASPAAARQANRGVHVEVRPREQRADVTLGIVPDRSDLDDLVFSLDSRVFMVGGDLEEICEVELLDDRDCEIGFTIEVLTATSPVDLTTSIGVARQGNAGVFGCGAEPRAFDESALVEIALD